MTKWAKLIRLPGRDKRLLLEAALLLSVLKPAIALVPFRRLLPWLEQGPAPADGPLTPGQQRLATQVRRAVERAARYLPGSFTCLAQAAAAKYMLRRRGVPSTLIMGVVTEKDRLKAHAWLECGEAVLTGGRGRKGFHVISRLR